MTSRVTRLSASVRKLEFHGQSIVSDDPSVMYIVGNSDSKFNQVVVVDAGQGHAEDLPLLKDLSLLKRSRTCSLLTIIRITQNTRSTFAVNSEPIFGFGYSRGQMPLVTLRPRTTTAPPEHRDDVPKLSMVTRLDVDGAIELPDARRSNLRIEARVHNRREWMVRVRKQTWIHAQFQGNMKRTLRNLLA